MTTNIVVPALGESVVEATVGKWLKREGDAVSAGEPLVELETDKVNLVVPAEKAGVLSHIERKEGEDVKVGDVLGSVDESRQATARSSPAPQPAAAAAPAKEQSAPKADGAAIAGASRAKEQPTPKTGGAVVAGAAPAKEQPTPKTDGVPASDGAPVNDKAASKTGGAAVADAASAKEQAAPKSDGEASVEAAHKATTLAQRIAAAQGVDVAQVDGSGPGGRVTKDDVQQFLTQRTEPPQTQPAGGTPSPSARAFARGSDETAGAEGIVSRTAVPAPIAPASSVPASSVPASSDAGIRAGTLRESGSPLGSGVSPASPAGPKGELAPAAVPVKTVSQPLAKPSTANIAPASGEARREERQRMSRRRQTIARRLVEAQHTAAMLTTFNEVDMSAVIEIRKRRKESFAQKHGIKLGIVSFFVKASIGALKAYPRLNAEIQDADVVLKHYYDIGMAIGAEEGLVVPVLLYADRMSFAEIERAIAGYVQKTRDGSLSIEDLRGGTFTITNGGVFGSLLSTPILNPPQVGILGLHKIQERPVALGGQVVIRPMMYVALSYDHRIVDGREAVQFLVRLKELVEDPESLLLEG